jgi:hypothetical protein
MIKAVLSKSNRIIGFKILILAALLCSFPLIGSDCDNSVIGGSSGNIIGKWQLTNISGYLQDVCEGEIVTYDTSGIATLKCPNSNPITRNYSISNNMLTYTETGVQYNINTLTTTTLVLEGRNVGRTLTYTKIPADGGQLNDKERLKQGKNSSE